MKNLFYSVFTILFSSISFSQIVNIPDTAFKAILLSADETNDIAADLTPHNIKIDVNQDGEIQVSEALAVYSLNFSGVDIQSLNGIEAFTNLQALSFSAPNLASLSLGNLTQLNYLNVSSNALLSLSDVEQMSGLHRLFIDCNHLTTVNFYQMHGLEDLHISSSTPIIELNLCGTAVRTLWCIENHTLQTINLKNSIVSGVEVGTILKAFPPALPNIWLQNASALQNVCYDEGEYPAIISTLDPALIPNINFSTDCDSSCMLANEQSFQNSLTLWPNPVENSLHIERVSETLLQSAKIDNPLGQLIKLISVDDQLLSIDVSDLKTGSYFLEITSDQGKVTKKFIKL